MTPTHTAIKSRESPGIINSFVNVLCFPAGKATTDDELEEMLESGNAAVFTAGVGIRECVGV